MIQREVTITNRLGLHARAAARFVATASAFDADIHVCRAERRVNGKSIMGLMMLAAGRGTTITVEAEGADAENAIESITRLVEEGFDENTTETDSEESRES